MTRHLSEKWIKASIAGTIWAASEIVLGSFLHNLRVPFSGNILTAIGIIILISISYIWKEKGLFWRAGLICAVMKTMSPSAVIFGPMIAIFSESVLIEVSTRLLGRTLIGYAVGAMLAMSWNLFHKIVSYIVYYGANIIDVYTNLLKMAQRQLNIQTDIVWLPILILLAVYALFGLLAAIIGIRVGRKMLSQPPARIQGGSKSPEILQRKETEFRYSVLWLFLNFILIISSMLILSMSAWYVWAPVIILIAVIWALRYRRAMRQLSKPKFWIIFVVITLLTAFVFTAGGEGDFWRSGLLTGISMNFRAIIIIMGFSALGTELYNPVVRNFFSKTAFRNLPLAVELSVESLPYFISTIPDFKSFRKNPVSVFYQVLAHAESRLSEIKGKKKKVYILTGGRAEGKTTYLSGLIEKIKLEGIEPSGIIAERVMNGNLTTGYDIIDIETLERYPFLSDESGPGLDKIGKFSVIPEGLAAGIHILSGRQYDEKKLIIIDEVGAMELQDEGWAGAISSILGTKSNDLLLVVRNIFVNQVIEKWDLHEAVVLDIHNDLNITAEKFMNKS
jgi:nucleoside-triphosphatase THEP1